MPSLMRLLVFCAVIAAIVLGTMVALSRVEPSRREIQVNVPSNIIDERNAARLPQEEADGKQVEN